MYKSKRSQATDIDLKTRKLVKERDQMCIFCGSAYRIELAHTILSRSNGGLGSEKNLVCACQRCHRIMDSESPKGKKLREIAIKYLERIYGHIDESEVKYNAKSK